MPLCYARNKSSARSKAKTKLSDEDKKLESGRELTLAQYSKIRYKFPAEVMTAAAGGGPMNADGDKAAPECVLLRLNCDAFEVHFRHEATADWFTSGYGQTMAPVRPPRLLLCTSTDHSIQ